jgi:hypothetical protein
MPLGILNRPGSRIAVSRFRVTPDSAFKGVQGVDFLLRHPASPGVLQLRECQVFLLPAASFGAQFRLSFRILNAKLTGLLINLPFTPRDIALKQIA